MSAPIATTYVEIRPTPNAKQDFRRDVEQMVDPAAEHVTKRIGKSVSDGLKHTSAQTGLAVGAGAALGTVFGQGLGRGIGAAMRGVTLLPRTGFAELKDYQAGLAQLQAGLKSTGGVAGLSAKQMEDLASSIQKYSGQTDDSIVKSESLLLTFTNLRDTVGKGNDVFTQATKLTADLAARFGGDASASAVQLGKALNDPVQGLTALTRIGISFTDQQKQQIKTMQESGDVVGAQKVILAELTKEVGGSADAYGKTLPGQIDRAKRSFEDISQNIVGATASFVDHNQKTTLALAGVVGGIYTAHKAVLAYRALQDTLFGSIGKKVLGNEALAKSYDGVALSATRAAEAETAAAGGGAGKGVPVAPVPVTGPGSKILPVVKSAGYVALAYETYKAVRDGLTPGYTRSHQTSIRQWQEDHGYRPKSSGGSDSQAPAALPDLADPRIAAAAQALAAARGQLNDPTQRSAAMSALAGAVGSPFDVLASRTQGDPAAAREAQRKADLAVRAAQRDYDKIAAGSGGASSSQLASAEARVASAQAAIRKRGGDDATEQARLAAAEAHLSELRAKGGVNADKLRAAEDRLKEARRTAAGAADDSKKAEATTALSVQDLTKRLGGQLKNTRGLRDDARALVKDGISQGVLGELYKLEKDAPGTLDRVAKGMTPAMAKQLDSQYAALQKANEDFLIQPLRAAVEAAKAEQDRILKESAKHQAAVYQKALTDAGVVLTPKGAPTPTGPGGRPEAPDTSAPADPTHGPPDPNEHGHARVTTKQTTIHMPNAVIVANDSKALYADLEKRNRIDNLR